MECPEEAIETEVGEEEVHQIIVEAPVVATFTAVVEATEVDMVVRQWECLLKEAVVAAAGVGNVVQVLVDGKGMVTVIVMVIDLVVTVAVVDLTMIDAAAGIVIDMMIDAVVVVVGVMVAAGRTENSLVVLPVLGDACL